MHEMPNRILCSSQIHLFSPYLISASKQNLRNKVVTPEINKFIIFIFQNNLSSRIIHVEQYQ